MLYLAFTLGLFGSLHCVGMCGPLALGAASFGTSNESLWSRAIWYQVGRLLSYMILGLLFGLIGYWFALTGLQNSVSIASGIILIVLFILSWDLEKLLLRIPGYTVFYQKGIRGIQRILTQGAARFPIALGFLNGWIPCGLVYLALAGSLSTQSIGMGLLFMAFFGLGTWPAMIALMLSQRVMSKSPKWSLIKQRAFPLLHLIVGAVLLYRGFFVKAPLELDFWASLAHPIMCG